MGYDVDGLPKHKGVALPSAFEVDESKQPTNVWLDLKELEIKREKERESFSTLVDMIRDKPITGKHVDMLIVDDVTEDKMTPDDHRRWSALARKTEEMKRAKLAGGHIEADDKASGYAKCKFTINTAGTDAILHFGRHRDKTLSQVMLDDQSYVDFIIRTPGFHDNLKDVARLVRAEATSATKPFEY